MVPTLQNRLNNDHKSCLHPRLNDFNLRNVEVIITTTAFHRTENHRVKKGTVTVNKRVGKRTTVTSYPTQS